jgi:phosphoribosylanthranilate isomerase
MATQIKICGCTRQEDAELAVELGALALGFNFYPFSPRYIAPAAARELVARLPPSVIPVGVFADEVDTERVISVAREAGVAAIQLHGPRFPNGAEWEYPLIRAVAVDEDFRAEQLRELKASAFLLDAFHPALRGGTGRTIDWAKARAATHYGRVILAGGLTPENVAEAIRQVRPFAVDVASGVEVSPGVKDAGKLRAFFSAVREADRT